jgi:glycosyltransferase involved in cell wall biosynthesis
MFTDAPATPAPDPRLRVAVVTGNFHCAANPAAVAANQLVSFLRRAGVPVRVFAPASPVPAVPHAGELVPVSSVGLPHSQHRLALGLPPSAKRELRHFAPTLVHLGSADLLGFAALRWARLREVPVVATCPAPHGEYLGALPAVGRWAAWCALRWFYRRCAEVYVPATSVADELRGNGVTAEILETPPGVDAERFHPGRRSHEWRRAAGIGDDEVVVAFAPPPACGARLGMFADVLSDLQANGLKFRVLVVGGGQACAASRAKLRDVVATGPLSPDESATALASADVFLDHAEAGAAGCGVLEAMASGLPVVVADSPTNRDVVRNGVDGIVCRPDDRSGFALVVRRVVENPAARANLRQAAVRRAANYRRDVLLGAMVENYNRVLRRWPLRPRW